MSVESGNFGGSSSTEFERGTVIGKFRLEMLLGRGGFGEVWKAQEEIEGEKIGTECAIKVMYLDAKRSGSSGSESFKATWVQEINALRSMTHQAIPRTIDGGIDGRTNRAFIAMELLTGETLAERIARKPLGWRRALVIAEQIASALDVAHARDIVHRDLKPQNVFLEKNGRICVIDWGIARFTRRRTERIAMPAPAMAMTSDSGGTADFSTEEMQELVKKKIANIAEKAFQIVGTPGYMAPEVLAGNDATAAVDAYALGVLLYQCLTGRLPYRISEAIEKSGAMAHARGIWDATLQGELIPLQELAPNLPNGVYDLVTQLLGKDPAARRTGELAKRVAHVNRFPHGVPDPPYAGLDAFGAERAGFLFGRDAHIERFFKRLKHQQTLVLSGPSGCGKSSLAIAGIAARVDRELLDDTDGWRLVVVRPSEARSIELVGPSGSNAETGQDANLGTIVVVDQLEEVLNLDAERQPSFCTAFAELAAAKRSQDVFVRELHITPEMPIRVVATVREDYEWQVVRIEALRELCETSRCFVTGVDATSAREVVEEPAKALGYRLGEGDRAIREVETSLAKDATALPIVQFALTEWWARRDEGKKELPANAWREVGGVEGALSYVADRHYRNLSESEQNTLRELFGRLLLGDRKQWVKASSLSKPEEKRLMDQLVALRLVKRRDAGDGGAGYELAHESLARRWEILQHWMSERAAEDALIVDLDADAKAWVRQGKPANRLRLDLVLPAAVRARIEGDVLTYVDSSLEAKRAAEVQEQANRRKKYVGIIAGLAVLLALVAGYAVQIKAKEADKSAALDDAKREKAAAVKAKTDADRARIRAEEAEVAATNAKKEIETERDNREKAYKQLSGQIAEARTKQDLERIQKQLDAQLGKKDSGESPAMKVPIISPTGSARVEPPW